VSDPCRRLAVIGSDGARLTGSAHGGQLLGWVPAGQSLDRLWTSRSARCGPGLAIRGGIPVVFPQFAGRGPLPQHGLARNRVWALESSGAPGPARFTARLTDDPQTRAIWPVRFGLELVGTAEGDRLRVELAVTNPADQTDDRPLEFTAALHCYLRIRHPQALVHGLAGLTAEDNAAGGATLRVPDRPLPARVGRDWAVRRVPGPVRVEDGPDRLELAADGFDDRVVWNPGPGHGLADVEPQGEERFVCLEPATLTPVTLAPGQTWRASMTLSSSTDG
jgi:glucose-6-phosphate 1-epimerase